MFLHPGIIALTLGSVIVLLLVFFASALGIKIIRRWDIKSSSEEQLMLERKTYLVSTLVQYALLFEVVSIFLFIYTAEDIHTLLAGAMCATGSLNANPFGFPALYAKIAVFFTAASWIAVNHLDNKAEDYPLIKMKYKLLLAALVLLITEFILQFLYFLKIEPDVITSCCGVMFSEKGKGIASSLASFPPLPAMILFYSLFAVTTATGAAAYKQQRKPFTYLLSIFTFMFFIFSIAAIISFISLYFYQLPTHHCPFDILQKEYYYIGYPLYAFLFAGSFLGIMAGVVERFKKIPSMNRIIPAAQKRWALYSIIFLTIFTLIASAPIILLPFRLY
ncbi:MAG: hypothetical protein COZ31_07840 [Nitrospirae bacterium CG_4_10_14_3_um_filter_44_29]|nr:hypothetical protein [Nitrospirota bacterium]OIO29068.1 MAG: hypothetical protein AUJ60_05955 [Nitrospirae bacterium CG1_02_44_142]PIP70386.1 MAG: hypothetical protein COW90_05535 [Nitrospirae bacterium CG22_combo_CG10-13_8_21_14_all_44_11]PIV43075.1 MAG: hypothetical protein COS28_02520 [Nitrospirae bacterium CG02_land_8_20_14_3_00_44_33]PIV65901.1 MAG: hypothetical protein COS10_08995 [Nitrospirae bacterium CG01_land_8_20_14_3_00_44_22]PIW90708.1 MAG: hypothetical protein COZ93_00700 [Nit